MQYTGYLGRGISWLVPRVPPLAVATVYLVQVAVLCLAEALAAVDLAQASPAVDLAQAAAAAPPVVLLAAPSRVLLTPSQHASARAPAPREPSPAPPLGLTEEPAALRPVRGE